MELSAQKREKLGKQAQTIKTQRKIPAVMFGKGIVSEPITVGIIEFQKVFSAVGETSMVDLVIDNKSSKVLIKDVQYDPITLSPIHASFYKVNLKEKIKAQVPVEVVGEEQNQLVKGGEALVLVLVNEVEVECLPSDLPAKFIVDVSQITEIGGGVTFSQLDFDKTKVELRGHHEADEFVVKLDHAGMAEEPVEEVEISEEEAIAKVAATKELSEEEKAKRAEEDKAKKDSDKKK